MSTPVVSVVVTTYNQCRYIRETLDSVFRQSYQDYEVIVVDDGSTDDTPSTIEKLQDRVRYVRQHNQGPAGSRNTGVRLARGELVAFLDGDDLWEPPKLEAQVAAAASNPGSGLIATEGVQFSEDGVMNGSLVAPRIRGRLRVGSTLTISCYQDLVPGSVLSTTSQVMIPRAVLDRVGASDPSFTIASDWDLYLRIAELYEFTFLAQRLIRWRYLPTSISGPAHLRQLRWATDEIAVLKKHLRRAPPSRRQMIRRALSIKLLQAARTGYHYGRASDKVWARRYLRSLLASNPTSIATAVYLFALALPASATLRVARLSRTLQNRLSPPKNS